MCVCTYMYKHVHITYYAHIYVHEKGHGVARQVNYELLALISR